VVDEEEWVERQEGNKGLVQCENLGRGRYSYVVRDPLSTIVQAPWKVGQRGCEGWESADEVMRVRGTGIGGTRG